MIGANHIVKSEDVDPRQAHIYEAAKALADEIDRQIITLFMTGELPKCQRT